MVCSIQECSRNNQCISIKGIKEVGIKNTDSNFHLLFLRIISELLCVSVYDLLRSHAMTFVFIF